MNEAPVPVRWYWLLIVPTIVGSLTGMVVGALVLLVERLLLDRLVLGLPGLWFAVPAVGVFLLTRLAMVRVAGTTKPGTADLYPYYYHHDEVHYPLRQSPGRILSGITTVGLGGSQGLESQSVLVGDSVGMLLRRFTRGRFAFLASVEGRKLLLVCGAAAGISTVFSSPLLGAAYGIEMPFRNRLDGRRIVPALLAAGFSYLTASLFHASSTLMTYVPHDIGPVEMLGVAIVAVLCGLGARAFTWCMHRSKSWKDGARPWWRATAAGLGLCVLTAAAFLATGAKVVAGPGYLASEWAIPATGPSPVAWLVIVALACRILSVLLCVAAGGGGGVFTSLATNGLLIGVGVAVLLGLDNVTLLALVGAGAFLGAGYRIPLAGAGL
ncbi:MAG: chloride channel protein, partial [Actinomycetes bacterium]